MLLDIKSSTYIVEREIKNGFETGITILNFIVFQTNSSAVNNVLRFSLIHKIPLEGDREETVPFQPILNKNCKMVAHNQGEGLSSVGHHN